PRHLCSFPTRRSSDLFNAPPGESDATELFPYWGMAVDAVVAQVKGFHQLFFVEPNVERNVTDAREAPPLPWSTYSSYPNVVYAPDRKSTRLNSSHQII